MESTIGATWEALYSNNPKIQAFAVCRGSEVLWQTSNWDVVADAASLARAQEEDPSEISVSGIRYKKVSSGIDFSVFTSDKGQGHLLMSMVEGDLWLVAWASADSIPDLAVIDLSRCAVSLIGKL
ncbi:MAG: hypothetical protein HXY34_02400 [Candidatus Thorarchaeota archaeon]|nr:hypothetical protein [Candidatus Thorarchaeota archaeon]